MSTSSQSSFPVDGGCVCRHIRYRMLTSPILTHCCHCTWCQRETGSAFVLHALIESDRMTLLTPNKPLVVPLPTPSGAGQQVSRCPKCYIAVWTDYNSGDSIRYVKVGTLDLPETCPPGVHIYTESKQSWVKLARDEQSAPVFNQYYDKGDILSKEALQRVEAVISKANKKG